MRTRFLNIDYFNSVPIQALEALDFLRLPLPYLRPSNLSICEDLRCFDDLSILPISLEIEQLPIDNALSKFFSHVIPNVIDVAIEELADILCSYRKDGFHGQRNSDSERIVELRTSEDEKGIIPDDKGNNDLEVVQFEMTELDLSLENAFFSEEENMHIFSEVSDSETNVDMSDTKLRVHHVFESLDSVFSVDNISPGPDMKPKADLLEVYGLVQGQNNPYRSSFPLLEVDETSLGIFSGIPVGDEFILLETIEPLNWGPHDEVMGDCKEFLYPTKFDILEYLSDHCLSKQFLKAEVSRLIFNLETDLINVIEYSKIEGNSAVHRARPDDDSIWAFEEFQYFDFNCYQFFDALSNLETYTEEENCEDMFGEATRFTNFNELIVSHELTPVDDSFRSLPIPLIPDHDMRVSVDAFVEEILAELKLQPSSASDGIYLDWHLLEEDNCKHGKYFSSWKFFEELDTYGVDSDLVSVDDGMLVLDFIFSDNSSKGPTADEIKEMLNIPNDGFHKTVYGEVSTDINHEKVLSLVETMPLPQFNDFEFFLNPVEFTTRKNHKSAAKAVNTTTTTTVPRVSTSDPTAHHAANDGRLQQWDIKLHRVTLSENILVLIDNLQKSYFAILENYRELIKTKGSYLGADDFSLLMLTKKELSDCIKKATPQRASFANGDGDSVTYLTLSAIKHMAWYLCYYGIHTTYLYIDNLCQNLQCLQFRLSFLHDLIEDAHGKANKEVFESHPSLCVIHKILQSIISQRSLKVLIVAEKVFWCPLKRLLISMKISHSVPQIFHTHTSQGDMFHNSDFTDAMLQSDCCLVSQEHVSPSFPFDKFGVILEYGGACGSSRVSTVSAKLVGFPLLHFVKVELEDSSVSKALCEGVDMPTHIGCTMKGDSHSIPLLSESNLEEFLAFIPVEEYKGSEEVKACSMPLPVNCVPLSMESKENCISMPSIPDSVVIVNTQNFDRDMIISRRSTYQRILAIEKEGTHVVERDLNLPVDVIVSAAVCLVWYDCQNIGKKATAPNEASSCLPLCVENIAANVLTSVSFAFSSCILVFEGESSFLAGIMESSDELYAAAASLGIDLQLFCSYSSETTDEIILSCIRHTIQINSGLYPKMPESETLAESFLTTFPSINPLSAHAILSSGSILDFFEWSQEDRIHALRKYHVPEESVTLLSAFLRFGEREDSKSGMTDCSSSVSSAHDSEYCHLKGDSEKRKRKYNGSPHNTYIDVDDLFHFQPFDLFTDGRQTPTRICKPCTSWISKGPEIFDGIGKSSLSFKDMSAERQGWDINTRTNPARVSNPSLTENDGLFGETQGLDMAMMTKSDGLNNNKYGRQDNFVGEVIDVENYPLGEEFFISDSVGLSPLERNMEKDPAAGISRTERKLSFRPNNCPTFPTSAEISSDSNAWISGRDPMEYSREGFNGDSDTYNNTPLKYQKRLVDDDKVQKSARDFCNSSFEQKGTSRSGVTPLSKAIRNAQPQHGSPWTIEFLNRIREKSKLRQQSLPHDLSAPCFGYSGNITKFTKRKSPSILDFYKYQVGSTPKKIIDHKRLKKSVQPSSSSKNEKTSLSFLPTSTPSDKRARRKLTFATNGSTGQSKLVWSNENSHIQNRHF